MREMSEMTKSEMLDEYNGIVQILRTEFEVTDARERRQFETRADAEKALANIRGTLAARKNGWTAQLRQDKLPADEQPPAGVPVETPGSQAFGAAMKEMDEMAKNGKAKTTKKSKVRARGAGKPAGDNFHPVRPDTARAKILKQMDGSYTPEQIAKKVGLEPKQVSIHLHTLWRDCGIGHAVEAGGQVRAVFPRGRNIGNCFKESE